MRDMSGHDPRPRGETPEGERNGFAPRAAPRVADGSVAQPAPLRIAYVITALGHGGAETQVILLAREMRRRGHAVVIARLRDRPDELVPDAQREGFAALSFGLNHHVLLLPALLRARRWVMRWRPDVVHAHMVHANLFTRALRVMAPIPRLISTAHSINEGGRLRMCCYRLTDAAADVTTHVSPQGVAAFTACGACASDRIRYIANGVDLERFRPDAAARARIRGALALGERPVFLAAGRLHPAKDYPTLITAFADVLRQRPDPVLLIAGDGPERSAVEGRIAELGIEQSVRLLGRRGDVPDLMNACDCFVMSSAWEGAPMALLEAMACDRPVITTEFGGAAALFGNSVRIVAKGAPEQLAAEMLAFLAQPPTGSTGRAYVERHFAIAAIGASWDAIYRGGQP